MLRFITRGVIPLAALGALSPALADPLSPTVAVHDNAAVDSGADHRPAIAMDGAGVVVVAWTSTDTLGGTIGADADVLFARSIDSGVTWTPAAPIAASAAVDAADDRGVSLATDRSGAFVAVWQSRGLFGADADVLFARSLDGGVTWSAPALLDTSGAGDADDDVTPRIAAGGNGRWITVWASTAGVEHDVMYSVSIDDGTTWSVGTVIDVTSYTDVDDDVEPVVATTEDGRWMIAWASNDRRTAAGVGDYDLVMVRSQNDGLSWSAPSLLNTNGNLDTGDDRGVDLATDGTRWLAVWHQRGSLPWGPDGDILTARSLTDGASWSAPREIYGFSMIELGDEQHPRVATDRAGNWSVVWWREDSLPGGVGQDVDVLQARSVDGGLSWVGPELINNDALSDQGNDYSPAIATSRTGNWRVVWHTNDTLGGTIGTDLDVVTSGAVCGDGIVQLAEQCDDGNVLAGDCCSPTCQLAPPLTVCRAAVGVCDVAEVCTGVDALCPADTFAPANTECRASTGACDPADVCSGVDAVCPPDAPAPMGTECRAAASACDAMESCDGASLACPADVVEPAGAVCRVAVDLCDAEESCDGVGALCPADVLAAAGVECRASVGVCDVAEACSGNAAACPPDARLAAGVLCRAPGGVCDAPEMCTGDADCPVDLALADGAPCADAVVCDGTEVCIAGACVMGAALACDDGNACTAESCLEPGGCGVSAVPGCCNDAVACDDANACTIDQCSGLGGTCSNTLIPGCCNSVADCDDLDVCTVDVCSGIGGTCGSTRISGCCTEDADCGAVACGTVACNLASNRCETTPVPNCCTADATCEDGDACTVNTCDLPSGACGSAPIAGCCNTNADCADDDACTADVCSGPGGTCERSAIAGCCATDGQCDDGDACTADTCSATTQRCEAASIAGCCAVDSDCAAGPVCTTVSCQAGACVAAPTPDCCTLDSECDDGDACSIDRCIGGTCERAPACEPDGGVPDGGVPDGTVEADAGEAPDAGPDAGPDATVDVDASEAPDAGEVLDAEPQVDAADPVDGATPDGGAVPDGASADGSTDPDGAATPDAGVTKDEPFELDDDGCECSSTKVTSAPSLPWLTMLLLGAVVVVRRLRRGAP